MEKLFSTVLLCCFCFVAFAANSATALQKEFTSLRTMSADFTQVTLSSKGEALQKQSGKMAVQRPGDFYWHILKPREELIVVSNDSAWVYDKDLAQVTHRKVDYKNPVNPAFLLSGDLSKVQDAFDVTSHRVGKFDAWYVLVPKDKRAVFSKLQLRFVHDAIKEMYITDKLGQHSMIDFYNIKINEKLSDSLFHFKIPKGVDVL
ncbi:MAG: outer membrane lipoprotein chaperone LolA [Gammaproteobacteria bacterium]|nr:outer membrane lipoprotein chaperone LolA [Gammaproteobacteria bacterium]